MTLARHAHRVVAVLIAILGATTVATPSLAANRGGAPAFRSAGAGYASLPIGFTPNVGQTDRRVKFVSSGRAHTVFLSPTSFALTLAQPDATLTQPPVGVARSRKIAVGGYREAVLGTTLVGADPAAAMLGTNQLPGRTNYLLGRDQRHWLTNLASYQRVTASGVYPGIDVAYYGNGGDLEYDFDVQAGSDPSRILLAFSADAAFINQSGDLVLVIGGRQIVERKPSAFQSTPRGTLSIAVRYTPMGANRFGFAIGNYDRSRPLVIDPLLSYSTYLGGSGQDDAYGLAVDSAGSAYIVGATNSLDFPSSTPWPGSSAGHFHAFISKLNAAGNALVYSTFVGGRVDDEGLGIAVDPSGNAYITGATTSADFPTVNAFQPTFAGSADAFAAELNASGSGFVYSTFLGGASTNIGYGIAVDASGGAVITGTTNSSNFPVVNPLRGTPAGGFDVFVTRLAPGGRTAFYSTYLGGPGDDIGAAVTLDSAGNAYVVGNTASSSFPTVSALQPSYGGNVDAFVTKLNPAGSALVLSTFLGGSGSDAAFGVAVDGSGAVYVDGYTSSTNFPTFNPAEWANHGGGDAFVSKLSPSGNTLVYSTYLGGNSLDVAYGIALGPNGSAFVAGVTASMNFPVASPLQSGNAGGADAFLTILDPGGAIQSSTYLGGTGDDGALAVAGDGSGNAYLAGFTSSTNFPVTLNGYQTGNRGGQSDAFVSKLPAPPPASSEWTTLMASNSHTGYNATPSNLTPATAPSSSLKWANHTGSLVTGQPVEANGLIYFTSWDGDVRAVDKAGRTVWATYLGVTFNNPPPPGCLGGGGGPTGTPTAVNIWNQSLLYVSGGDSNLYALDALTGAVDWHTRLGPSPDTFLWSSPTVYNGNVYVGLASLQECPAVQGKEYELSATTGVVEHVFNTVPDGCTGAPVLSTAAVDPSDGSLFVATGNSPGTCTSPNQLTASILKLRANDLTLLDSWQMPAAEQTITDPDFGASAMFFTATIGGITHQMLGLVNKTGVYYAFDRSSLSAGPVWRATIAVGNNCPVCGPGAAISPSAFDGTNIYVGGTATTVNGISCAGSVRALDPASGAFRWERCMSGPVLGSVSAVPGLVIAGVGPDLTIFAADTGNTLFVYHDPNPNPTSVPGTTNFWGGPSISEGVIYEGNIDGNLFAVSP